jgi:putative hydrolase of the HAD superfamily
MAYTTRREVCPLGEVETWIFDLDNTLYPGSCGLFTQVQQRMNQYICTRLAVTPEEAAALRARYFREHGTTMNGLMVVNRIDPHEFLNFVHDIDHSVVPANPDLVVALSGLAGRKLVYTNGSVRHAENLLAHLGIAHLFEDIFDIVASEFAPKPAMAPFRTFVGRFGVEPRRALMLEDMAINLAPAAELGMTTAWVHSTLDWATADADKDHIHHVVEDLAGFIAAASALQQRRKVEP